MPAPSNVFISAISSDLRSLRQVVKDSPLTIRWHPVAQTNSSPDARTVEEMLRGSIAGCHPRPHPQM